MFFDFKSVGGGIYRLKSAVKIATVYFKALRRKGWRQAPL